MEDTLGTKRTKLPPCLNLLCFFALLAEICFFREIRCFDKSLISHKSSLIFVPLVKFVVPFDNL